jgi:hypothetical protein
MGAYTGSDKKASSGKVVGYRVTGKPGVGTMAPGGTNTGKSVGGFGLGKGLGNLQNGFASAMANGGFQQPANQWQQQPQQSPFIPQQGPNGYQQTQAPYGVDQTMAGAGEQMWQNNQNMWMKGPAMDWVNQGSPDNSNQQGNPSAFGPQGAGSQFWTQVQGSFNKAFESKQPQFDAYYDRARDKAAGAANAQAAARGVYGSSQALNNVGNVIADVEAQRAKAGTDFMLADANNQRQMLGTYGNLAFGAGGENQQYDQQALNRLNSGFNAAMQAQNLRDNRLQNMFGNVFAQQNQLVPWAQGQYAGMFDADQNIFGAGQDAYLGQAQQNQNYKVQARQNATSGLNDAVSTATGIVDLGKKVKEY